MGSEIQALLEQFAEQAAIIAENADTCETKKASSKRVRKATSEAEKIGKALRKATIAAEKK